MSSPTRDPASIKSEVFYWQLLGLQVFIVDGLIAVAFLTGSLSIRGENFDATVLTVTVIFASDLLYMPHSKEAPCFACSRLRKEKLSNANIKFFFRIHSALCLDPQAGGKAAKRRVLCFLAALWAFAFRPLLGVR